MGKPLSELYPIADIVKDLAKEDAGHHSCSRALFPLVNRALNDVGYMAVVSSFEAGVLHFHIERF